MFDVIAYALALKRAKAYTDLCFQQFPKGLIYKGAVSYYSDLPNSASIGDIYTVKYIGSSGTSPDGREYAWGLFDGTEQWILISGITDVINADGSSIVANGIASIPKASINQLGVSKPNGSTVIIDSNGVLGIDISEHTDKVVNSENGAHSLRYYNGTLQYYNDNTWVTISIADLII